MLKAGPTKNWSSLIPPRPRLLPVSIGLTFLMCPVGTMVKCKSAKNLDQEW